MPSMTRERALRLLTMTLEEGSPLAQYGKVKADYERWSRDVRIRVSAIFGQDSLQLSEAMALLLNLDNAEYHSRSAEVPSLLALLNSFASEVSELWSDEPARVESPVPLQSTVPDGTLSSNKVFIVHGHDTGRTQEVARFLERLQLIPIILHERASSGATVVEKLERHADVAYAVVLLTPDDAGSLASELGNLRPRARQNVVLELGYFLGRLGRNRTCALVAQRVEIPSDYAGVVYIPIDASDEWKIKLARELRASGLLVDMNNVI